jgi:hypothetical protein
MTACPQLGCTGTIVDDYCDVCGSPAGAPPFVPAGAAASAASPGHAAGHGLTAGRRRVWAAVRRGVGVAAVLFLLGCAVVFYRVVPGFPTSGSRPSTTASPAPTWVGTRNMPTSTTTPGASEIIQLEDLADSARPFEAVRIQGSYRGGAGTFLRVQRWERGKWLDFPLPTKTDQSGQFITQAEFGRPGRYWLRVLDPDSEVASKPFVLVIKG